MTSSGTPTGPGRPRSPVRRSDAILYIGAAISYIGFSVYNKWLLDWIVGPVWLVAWVWGIPALGRLVRRQPVFPPKARE